MNNLKEEILEKIKKEEIHPIPRWVYDAKNYLFWALFVISVLIGGVAFASIIFVIKSQNLPIGAIVGFSGPRFLLLVFPYFWLIVLAVFITFAFFEIKNTKTGYRYNTLLVLVISILLSIILGSLLFISHAGGAPENILRRRVPLYKNINHSPEKMIEMMRQNPDFERNLFKLRNIR
ncbi:hypothetical protein HYV44_02820 [Candidatus Microgenomates bacterium]|nr:hypothetical protein [Candidatus Microgenomates bacterium]